MSIYANQYNAWWFLSNQKLQEISIVLKNGSTVQSKVMDLIFTILGCIVLQIDDHRTHLREFKDIFSKGNLTILRNDLENLLRFNTKLFNYLILELVLLTLEKERGYVDRCIKVKANGFVPRRHWNEVLVKRKVKTIVRFLIFRKTTTNCCLRGINDASDWSSCKENINVIFNNEMSRINIFARQMIAVNKNDKYLKPSSDNYQKPIADQRYTNINNAKSLRNRLETKHGLREPSKCICGQRLCEKIYRLLCCGWLWLSLYYLSTFL